MNNIPTSSITRSLLSAGLLLAFAATAGAGTFSTIAIDGDFSDWASVPAAITDPNDSLAKDINQIFLANDATNLYIRITYYSATNPNEGNGFFLAFDNDNNSATGFNVYGLGVIGSEGAYQNDFPFEQAAGVFNTGSSTAAAIAISPYNVGTTSQEFSIPRSAVIDTANSQLLFPSDSFAFGAYFNDGANDYAGAGTYTFAVPETSSALLGGLGVTTLLLRRRRD